MGYPKGVKRCGRIYPHMEPPVETGYSMDALITTDNIVAKKCRRARPCALHVVTEEPEEIPVDSPTP